MERTAFSRAWDYLAYSSTFKWGAIGCAIGSGAFYVVLLLVLALFADLLVFRGRIPSYADLNEQERLQFRSDWNGMPEAQRREALETLPTALREPDLTRLSVSAGRETAATEAQSLRWKAYVATYLQNHVHGVAAAAYRDRAVADPQQYSGTDHENVRLGILSLVIRTQHQPIGRLLAWTARYCGWTWQPTDSGLANRPYLTGLLLVAVAMASLRLLLTNGMHYCAAHTTLEAVTRMRRLIYHQANRLGSLTLVETGPVEAVSLFTRHVEAVHDGLYTRLTVVVREPVKFVLLFTLVLLIHPWLGIAFLCTALLVWLLGRQVTRYFRRHARSGARRAANQLGLLQESVKMLRLVKGYLMELFNQARVERQLSEYHRAQLHRFRGETIYRPLLIFFGTVAGAALMFVAGWIVLSGGMTVANLVVMATALVSMYFPLDTWLAQRRLVNRAEDSAVVVFDFLDRRGEVGQVVGAEFLKSMTKAMDFDQISLREPGTGRMLLDGLTMRVDAGTRSAIVGVDEGEKHALVSLIPRFLDPSSGEVSIDGRNLRWVTLDSLRNQVALVLQQNYVFNDTVANNIGCGDPSYSVPQIIEAAKMVHAHNFVQRLPNGYETPIGELGHALRVGEQFRIALARAILRDPAILIIEEPDVPMDEGTISMLDDAYARLFADRTVIFLPHRLHTVKMCDRVYVINNGKLEAAGAHRELLQESDLYRHLLYLEYNMFAERG